MQNTVFSDSVMMTVDSTPKEVYYGALTARSRFVITKIEISKHALKELRQTPDHIQAKFRAWLVAVQNSGIAETRKIPGWHDEPLSGNRKGQRSIRLNKQWRAIYIINKDNTVTFIEVIEVTPHAY